MKTEISCNIYINVNSSLILLSSSESVTSQQKENSRQLSDYYFEEKKNIYHFTLASLFVILAELTSLILAKQKETKNFKSTLTEVSTVAE